MDKDETGDGTSYSYELKPWEDKTHTTDAVAFRLMALPMELQLGVLDQVDLRGLVELRRTCRFFRSVVITRGYLVRRFTSARVCVGVNRIPAMDTRLRYCCSQCLTMPPARLLLLAPDGGYKGEDDEKSPSPHPLEGVVVEGGEGGEQHCSSDGDYGWKTLCHRCWRPRLRRGASDPRDLNGICKMPICVICGWPCPGYEGRPRLHPTCRMRRRWLKLVWCQLGVVSFVAGLFSAIASWGVYNDDLRSLVPSSINIGLMIISWITVVWGLGFETGRYKWPLALEFAQAVLWLPPLIANAQYPECDPLPPHLCDSLPRTTLAIYIVNFVFRALNTVGYAMLASDYDFRNLFLPDLSKGRKTMYAFAACLVWWAVVA
ncbi:hypothetical protein PG993_012340 [Apiospora rasikravindrae]|uniref:F-box domain-containing protein n=1 Tax=Apiospora rasikravindrae TaxID=990691 RepID=A0ABR1S4I5_9PEZI